jgi:hypothetical protein
VLGHARDVADSRRGGEAKAGAFAVVISRKESLMDTARELGADSIDHSTCTIRLPDLLLRPRSAEVALAVLHCELCRRESFSVIRGGSVDVTNQLPLSKACFAITRLRFTFSWVVR